ncbi:MAG: heme biosynthesis protein HemY [Gammaproteobacteria bacterium]|nr:heme biosynthesis protein HemY [Gammaproteobacteria bacterium]
MRTLVFVLLTLIAAVLLALAVKEDNGYVLIGYGHRSIEGSLVFFTLLNLLLFALLYFGIRFIARLFAIPGQFDEWQDRRGSSRARKELTQGLVELSEGHWKSAEQNLVRHASHSDTPLLNYLAAARSAQQQDAHERRDQYLQLAHESMPSADIAVGLTQAELQLAHEQVEQALATLQHLRRIAPRHTHVLKMLKELYERVGDWDELNQLLPELKKRKVINRQQILELEEKIYCNLLDKAASNNDLKQLNSTWKSIPHNVRENKNLFNLYTRHLMKNGAEDQVEELLRMSISNHWDVHLVDLYSRLSIKKGADQLSAAEEWLNDHPHNPVLLLTLGRLCMKNHLWGKARSYLEASIGANPTTAAYRELGTLLEGMGEHKASTACFKAGLELTSDYTLPELPEHLGGGQMENPADMEQPTDINPPKLEVKSEPLPESHTELDPRVT